MNEFKGSPPKGDTPKHRATEEYYADKIDTKNSNAIFSRQIAGPNSLSSYWDRIMDENGIPLSEEDQKNFFLFLMDEVNLGDFYKNRLPSDKIYLNHSLDMDYESKLKDPSKYNERLLERVYAYCLTKAFLEKDVIFGGDNEEISLDSCIKTHPYDLKKRQIQQILSIKDERFPKEKFNIGLGVQWGHENTSEEAIKHRLSYIVSGIVDYNSMTEIRYTTTGKKEEMPTHIPFVVVGGDIKNMTYFIDKVMKGEYSEITTSSILYNSLIQIKTQIDLFYKIALQQKSNYSVMPISLNENDKNIFISMSEKAQENAKVFASLKNIIDQILEANDPLVKKAKPDSIHDKIMRVCAGIAEENNV